MGPRKIQSINKSVMRFSCLKKRCHLETYHEPDIQKRPMNTSNHYGLFVV